MSVDLSTHQTIAARYTIVAKIGEGGQGVTWLAQDAIEGRRVVLKEFTLKQAASFDSMVFFEREAQVLAKQAHPRIPRYVDYFEDGGRYFLAQEYVEGDNLSVLIEEGRRWTEAELQKMTRQVLEILVYLQTQTPPVIHRDIKPANLIMGPEEQLVLVDFGAIHCLEQELHGAVNLVGTTGYMAPEQFTGRSLLATDLYSLGATIVHVASHRHPAQMPCEGLALKFQSLVQLSKPFTRFLEILTDPMAEDRFSDAKEALHWLDHLESVENYEPGPGHELMTRAGPPGTRVVIRRTAGELHVAIPRGMERARAMGTLTALGISCIATVGILSLMLRDGLRAPGAGMVVFFTICVGVVLWMGLNGLKQWRRLASHRLDIGPELARLVSRDGFGREKVQTIKTRELKLDEKILKGDKFRPGRLPGYIEVRDGAWSVAIIGTELSRAERRWILDEAADLAAERSRHRRLR